METPISVLLPVMGGLNDQVELCEMQHALLADRVATVLGCRKGGTPRPGPRAGLLRRQLAEGHAEIAEREDGLVADEVLGQ